MWSAHWLSDAVAATLVSASSLRRDVIRRDRERDELFYRDSEERRVACDRKIARETFAGIRRTGNTDQLSE